MHSRSDVRTEDIISEEEALTIGRLQDFHAARVARAASGLAETLDLDGGTAQRLVGAMTMNLAGVNFDERQEIADELDEISARLERITDLLGGTTTATDVTVVSLVAGEAAVREVDEDTVTPSSPAPGEGPTATDRPAPKPRKETGRRPKAPVSLQQPWFSVVYDEDMAAKIATASPEELNEITEALGEKYVGLKLQRMGPEIKALRIQQLREHLLEGRAIADIATEAGMKEPALKQALLKVAATLSRRIDQIELVEVLPDFDSRPVALPKPQRKWYTSLLGDSDQAEAISLMTAAQQAHLAERLGHYLNPLLLRQWGHATTHARLDQMKLFLQGMSPEEIADRVEGEVSVGDIAQNLRHAKTRLKDRVQPQLLLKLVEEAREYKPKDA